MTCRHRFGVLSVLICATAAAAQPPVATFTLRDYLKREWQNELVFFPVAEGLGGSEDLVLLGPDDAPLPFQWVDAALAPSGKPSIALLASMGRFGEVTYRLAKGRPAADGDLKVRQDGGTVTVENRLVGITLGGPGAAKQGPIAGVRLPSGRTVAAGRLDLPHEPTGVETRVVAAGPVFAEAAVDYTFPDHGFWRLRFRVIAAEPVLLVDEQFQLGEGARYVLSLADRFGADRLFYRDNGNQCRTAAVGSIAGEPLFRIEPWPAWWGDRLQAHWLGVFREGGDDFLALAVREPGTWVLPDRTEWDTAVAVDHQLRAAFQLRGFERHWMLVAMPRSEAILGEQLDQRVAPPPQRYVMKYDDVALDRVKDWVLEWNDRGGPRPRLFTTPDELVQFRRRFAVDQDKLAKLRGTPVSGYGMDDHVAYYLATGDEALGRRLADFALQTLQSGVDFYARQDRLRNQGSCPHHRNPTIFQAAIASDLVLGSKVLSAEERARIKAQLAFLGYTLARPSVISPERGFQANPNMTSVARACLGIIACTIPDHPHAKDWAALAVAEMEKELDQWCDHGGGWLEAPHYMTVSMDALIPLAMALRGTGFSDVDWLYHPKLKKTLAWLAKISTPGDPRLDGDRGHPAIGNTYLGERTCLSGWAARIWHQRDPDYARQMQWMWRAHGSFAQPGIGGAYPGFAGYRHLMLDESIPASPPQWGSESFPETGAVFRAHFPGERETYLYYIQGKMHQHYDFDEGSFVLWGKGRPLCEDFGYYGRAPAADHSRIDDGFYEALGVEGKIQQFVAGDAVDYLRGQRHGWHRQIQFVKDDDPLGPTFFVIRDAVLSGRDFDWRLYLATDQAPGVRENPIRAKGRFDADLVVFFLQPADRSVTTQNVTRTAGTAGWGHDGRTSSQYCLRMKQLPGGQPVSVVLYPVLQDQPTPKFTALCDGRVVKIQSQHGTDYAMLALERFQFSGEGIEFDGKSGALRIRPDGVRLSLPRRGTLTYRGQTVSSRTEPQRTITRAFRLP